MENKNSDSFSKIRDMIINKRKNLWYIEDANNLANWETTPKPVVSIDCVIDFGDKSQPVYPNINNHFQKYEYKKIENEVEPKVKTYTKEEVIALFNKFMKTAPFVDFVDGVNNWNDFDKWLKENVK